MGTGQIQFLRSFHSAINRSVRPQLHDNKGLKTSQQSTKQRVFVTPPKTSVYAVGQACDQTAILAPPSSKMKSMRDENKAKLNRFFKHNFHSTVVGCLTCLPYCMLPMVICMSNRQSKLELRFQSKLLPQMKSFRFVGICEGFARAPKYRLLYARISTLRRSFDQGVSGKQLIPSCNSWKS